MGKTIKQHETLGLMLRQCLPLALCLSPLAVHGAKSLGDLTGPWQLFLDDYLIKSKVDVVRTYHPFCKYTNNPVVVVDQPWEHNVINSMTVLPNEAGDGFRLWYYCWGPRVETRRGGHGGHTLYATSKDGIHWEKPNLGLHAWSVNGSKENNFVSAYGSIMHTPNDPDPARRYKAIGPGSYIFSASPDGINWEKLSKNKVFSAGDTGHFFWDPRTQKYRGYAKVGAMVSGLRRRAVGYSEGAGYESWPEARLIMAPDDFDDRWAKPGSIQRTHFYNCPIIPYQDLYIGFMMIFRGEDDEGYFHGPMFVELVTSRDGFHWLREEGDRPPILTGGPDRSWDHGMVTVASLVVVGDEMRIYYGGFDGYHDYLPFHSAIGMATLRKDGFASLDGGDNPGGVTTKRLKGLKGKLRLNCEAGAGLLQVEVLDANGKVLPGYRRMDCNEPRGDGVDQVISWAEHEELPGGDEPLRLKFYLKNVSLYAFRTDGVVEVLEETAPAPYAALFTFENEGGKQARNRLASDGQPVLRFLGTSRYDRKKENAAFGAQSVTVASQWRPLNTLQITGTSNALGTHFTLAVMAKSADNRLARLFSSYNGNKPVNTSELVFDYDPSGKVLSGLRLSCKGIPVMSEPVDLGDKKYHHLCVTYEDGHVRFYADGKEVGEAWLPNGAPVVMGRDLLVGEDWELGSDEQFNGNMDDILVLGRVLSAGEIKDLSTKGGEVSFRASAGRAQ